MSKSSKALETKNRELLGLIRKGTGDESTVLMELWECNQGMIQKVCWKFRGYVEQEDALQEAFIPFSEAVKDYDPEGEHAFYTHVSNRITWHLIRYIQENGSAIRIPAHLRGLIGRYRRFVRQWYQTKGDYPDREVIRFSLGLSEDQMETLEISLRALEVASLNSPLTTETDNEATLQDMIPDYSADFEDEVIEEVFRRERAKVVWDTVDTLKRQDADAIRMYYKSGMTYEETGSVMGVSGNAVRQRIASGFRMLRRGKRYRILRDFIDESPAYSNGIRGSLGTFRRTSTSATERAALKSMEVEEYIRQIREGSFSGVQQA